MKTTNEASGMDASELLRRGADYIDEHGWIQGKFNVGGSVCAIGALQAVSGEQYFGFPRNSPHGGVVLDAVVRLHDHLGLDAPYKDAFGIGNAVADWNDSSKMTAREVTAAMRAAADAN